MGDDVVGCLKWFGNEWCDDGKMAMMVKWRCRRYEKTKKKRWRRRVVWEWRVVEDGGGEELGRVRWWWGWWELGVSWLSGWDGVGGGGGLGEGMGGRCQEQEGEGVGLGGWGVGVCGDCGGFPGGNCWAGCRE